MHICINKWPWAPQGWWMLSRSSLNPGLALDSAHHCQFAGRSVFSYRSPGRARDWLGRGSNSKPRAGVMAPASRGHRRAAGPGSPSAALRGARLPSTPCARCCRSCAPAGAGARGPPLPPACPGERVQGPGRTAPWPSTVRRSAASPTPPITASSSVSSSRGPRRAARQEEARGGACAVRGLHSPSFGLAVVAEQARPPPRMRGPAPSRGSCQLGGRRTEPPNAERRDAGWWAAGSAALSRPGRGQPPSPNSGRGSGAPAVSAPRPAALGKALLPLRVPVI